MSFPQRREKTVRFNRSNRLFCLRHLLVVWMIKQIRWYIPCSTLSLSNKQRTLPQIGIWRRHRIFLTRQALPIIVLLRKNLSESRSPYALFSTLPCHFNTLIKVAATFSATSTAHQPGAQPEPHAQKAGWSRLRATCGPVKSAPPSNLDESWIIN